MKIYLTILLTILLAFACDTKDPSIEKCTSNSDCTDTNKPICNDEGACVAKKTLFINEVMASNDSYLDGSDWVEIYNDSDVAIDLAGYYFCDNHYDADGIDTCTQIPNTDSATTTVASKGFLVVIFNKDLTGTLNVTQNLGGSGDSIYLISPDKDILDSYTYDETSGLDTDISIGRYPDGSDEWVLFSASVEKLPTPGASNGSIIPSAVCTEADTSACVGGTTKCLVDNTNELNNRCVECLIGTDCDSGTCKDDNSCKSSITQTLFINEIMASNTSYTNFPNSDWVEIYNNGDTEVDLAGYYLCDDHYDTSDHVGTIGDCTQVQDTDAVKTTVASKDFIVFYFNKDGLGEILNVAQNLGGSGDTVTLIDRDGKVVDSKIYLATDGLDVDNISLGRSIDGGDSWVLFGDSLELAPTPMIANGSVSNTPVCTEVDTSACVEATTKCLVDTENSLNNSCVECLTNEDCTDGICNDQNVCEVVTPPEIKLFINEIMASNASYTEFTDSDWVEIYNDSDVAVDLAGYYLCDDHYDTSDHAGTIGDCTQVQDTDAVKTTVASKGFIVFYFNKDDLGGILNVAQKLGGTGDTVTLINPSETVVDSYSYTDVLLDTDDNSEGRSTDGGDSWEIFTKDGTKEPTPGATNVQ